MKRLFLLVLAAMLCLGMLAACNAQTTTTPAPTTTTTPAPVVPTTTPAPVDPTTTPAPVDPTTTTPEPTTTTTTPAPVVEYTVSFEVDGVVVDTAVVEAGQAVAKPAEDPSKLDYTFDYWTLDGAEYDFADPVLANITLVAKFTAIPTFTVTFQGADVPAQTVKTGEKVTKPADPEKAGFTFKGWTLNGEAYDFDAAVTADITLVAVFEEIIPEFTVTFEGADVAAQKVLRGQKATKPADPEKDGYTFKGWTLNGEAYDFDAAVTADITLVAVFEEIPVVTPENVTVKFVDAEGTEIKSVTVAYGANVALPSNSDYFYSFAPADALYNVKADKTVVLTATAKVGYETVSRDPTTNNPDYATFFTLTPNATGAKPSEKAYGTILFREGQAMSFTAELGGELILNIRKTTAFADDRVFHIEILVDGVIVTTFDMDGTWKDGEYKVYIPSFGTHTVEIMLGTGVNVPAGNQFWEAAVNIAAIKTMEKTPEQEQYTVKFAGDGVAIDPVTVVAGDVVAAPTAPVRAGYTFKGWTLAGVAYDFSAPVNADIILEAVWEANESYTVKFVDAEGNELGTSTVLPGQNATLPAGETFWGFAPADALYNINEDKTVVLTAISKEGYGANAVQHSMNYSGTDEQKAAYDAMFTVTGKTAKQAYGTLLWTAGDTVTATVTGAGELKFHLTACNKTDTSEQIVEILVDGVVVSTYKLNKDHQSTWYSVYLPSEGEHTVTFSLVSNNETTNKWGPSAQLTAIQVFQKTAE